MFSGRCKKESLEKPVLAADATGFSCVSWKTLEPISIYLLEKSAADYHTNELDLTQIQGSGFTMDSRPQKGYRIAGKWIVQSVSKHQSGYSLSLASFKEG